jgi:hypothetical protein
MALEGSGTTMASPNWMNYKAPEARLDAQDGAKLEAVDIRRQQIFNPKVMGSTAATAAWKVLHAGITLEAGVRVKSHGGATLSAFLAVGGATGAENATDTMGIELRPGEEVFLEVNNLNLVSRYGGNAGAGITLSYIGN